VLYTLRIKEVIPGSRRARIVRIALDGREFKFRAGQSVRVANHGDDRRRTYSLSVSPADVRRDGLLELLVGVDDVGRPGPHLTLDAGTAVDVEGPIGDFALPDLDDCERVVFIAGGTGIAPLRGMLREAVSGSKQIAVIYSARTPTDFAYGDELSQLAASGRIELTRTITRDPEAIPWQQLRGRITVADLGASDPRPARYVICGPVSMVREVHALLESTGTPTHRILIEEWCRPKMTVLAPAASLVS
jgi:ferredoxin-NADP reductase